MILTSLIAALLMQQASNPSPNSSRWQVIGNEDGGEYAIDPEAIQWQGRRARVYIRVKLAGTPDEPGLLGVIRYVYDCNANTVRAEVTDIYDADGTYRGSDVVAANELRDSPIEPDSPNSKVKARLCA